MLCITITLLNLNTDCCSEKTSNKVLQKLLHVCNILDAVLPSGCRQMLSPVPYLTTGMLLWCRHTFILNLCETGAPASTQAQLLKCGWTCLMLRTMRKNFKAITLPRKGSVQQLPNTSLIKSTENQCNIWKQSTWSGRDESLIEAAHSWLRCRLLFLLQRLFTCFITSAGWSPRSDPSCLFFFLSVWQVCCARQTKAPPSNSSSQLELLFLDNFVSMLSLEEQHVQELWRNQEVFNLWLDDLLCDKDLDCFQGIVANVTKRQISV